MEEQKEQIGRNLQKFVRNSYEIRTNFVRISHMEKIHTNLFT